MPGIFVDDSDTFEITVRYIESDGKIGIVEDDVKDAKSITVVFKKPDYATSQAIIGASTDHTPGGSNLNVMALRNNMFFMLAKSWNAKDLKGNPIPMIPETIGKLRIELAKGILAKLIEFQGENVI